jgi:hypothetical protein
MIHPPSIVLAIGAGLALAAPLAQACGRELLGALNTGQHAYVASRFVPADRQATADDAARLQTLLGAATESLGELRSIAPARAPATGTTKAPRLTVAPQGLPAQYGSAPAWFNADSSTLGAVRIHWAMSLSGGCQVHALHVESDSPRAGELFESIQRRDPASANRRTPSR